MMIGFITLMCLTAVIAFVVVTAVLFISVGIDTILYVNERRDAEDG